MLSRAGKTGFQAESISAGLKSREAKSQLSLGSLRHEMKDTPYSRFGQDDLILRDELAIDRTLLANERTLLAYLRSGVALLIAGVTIIHFSLQGWFLTVGIACIPVGIAAGLIGVARYRKMNRSIVRLRKHAKPETEARRISDRSSEDKSQTERRNERGR
jgi:putative membrane protein